MITVENIETHGWQAAVRGMRNPLNSWDKSDSTFEVCEEYGDFIGKNDLDLMQRLYKGGTEHRKYLRMITVTTDITAPLYWWKEFDTYKVGTVCNSCSTMHKIHAKEFEMDDFSHEHLCPRAKESLKNLVGELNGFRKMYLKAKDDKVEARILKEYWWQMIQLLPSSYNQRRTIQLSYENVMTIIEQRERHKLDEWRYLAKLFRNLPYVKDIRNEEH